MRRGERGASGIFVAVILVLLAASALAILALTRTGSLVERGARVTAQFKSLDDALVQFVVTNGRLPCPANPASSDGVEAGGGATACTSLAGTVPWKTIGARAADALDPWGQKVSYRVYSGATGLTQEGGASMVDCDTSDTGPTDATGRCAVPPAARDTGPASFLAAKGLQVTDLGTLRTDVAYVLISHGPTGLGGHTGENVARDLPTAGGDELANTLAAGPFVIKGFSAAGTDPLAVTHFDDYLSYKRVEELVRAAGLYARNWPEEAATTPRSVTFDQAAVDAAVGAPVSPGASTGQVSVNFLGVVASGQVSGGSTAEISFDVVGGYGGIGVAGGGSSLIQSSANERLSISLPESFTQFAVTLNDFGYYGSLYLEIVEFRFYLGTTEIAGSPRYGIGCNIDGGLATFSGNIGALFDRVDVTPLPAYEAFSGTFSGISALLVSEVTACPASEATCTTSLATPANTCTLF